MLSSLLLYPCLLLKLWHLFDFFFSFSLTYFLQDFRYSIIQIISVIQPENVELGGLQHIYSVLKSRNANFMLTLGKPEVPVNASFLFFTKYVA